MNKNRMTIYRWNGHTCNKSSKTLEKTQRDRSDQTFIQLGAPVLPPQSAPDRPADTVGATGSTTDSSGGGDFSPVEKEALETNRQPLCLDMFGQFGLIICCFLIPWDIFVSGWTSNWLARSCGINNAYLEWSETDRNWSFNVCVTQEFFGLVAMISFGKRLMLMINWHPLPVSKHNVYRISSPL